MPRVAIAGGAGRGAFRHMECDDHGCLPNRCAPGETEATRRVQNLVEERRQLVDEKTAQINRLTDHLKVHFPQVLEWFGRLDTELVCALLERWLEPVADRSFGLSRTSRPNVSAARMPGTRVHAKT